MTEVIHERSPRSRGRVRCDDCGRRIPEGEQYSQSTVVGDGMIWNWRECQPCETASWHVLRWMGYYSDGYYNADDFQEWASELLDYGGDALRPVPRRRGARRLECAHVRPLLRGDSRRLRRR